MPASKQTELLSLFATATLIACFCGLRFLLEPRFFYWDDTQHTFAPVFYTIGEELRKGNWPTITLLLWQGGFLAGEGLYQLFNPIALAVFATLPSIDYIPLGMAVHATIWLILAGTGAHLLALRLGSDQRWAVMAGVAYATSPYLVYWLAASWINGAIAYSALPWVLLALASRHPSALTLLGLSFATYTVAVAGWIHAIFAVLIFGVARILLPSTELSIRSRLAFGLSMAGGALLASPQLLSTVAAVSASLRASNVANSGTHVADLQGLFTAFWPTYVYPMRTLGSEWGPPVYYAAWFLLPALLIVARKGVASIRWATWLVGPALVLLLASLGPEQLGPSRYPMRLLPAAWCALIAVAATVVSNHRDSSASDSIRWAALFLVLAAIVSWQSHPDRVPLLTFWVATLLLATIVILRPMSPLFSRVRTTLPILATVLIPLWSMADYPLNHNFADYRGPERRTDIESLDVEPPGSYVQVYSRLRVEDSMGRLDLNQPSSPGGKLIAVDADEARWLPTGNMGLWRHERLVNGYSPTELTSLKVMVCSQILFGWTCDGPARTLLAREKSTGSRFAELMRLDAVLVSDRMKETLADFRDLPGWTEEALSIHATLFRRAVDQESFPGTVSFVSEGAHVDSVAFSHHDRERVLLRRRSGFSGGLLAFARAYYPGHYALVDGVRTDVERLGGVITAVRIPAGEGALSIEVRHELPMGPLWRTCLVLGCLLVAAALWLGLGRKQFTQRRVLHIGPT